MKQTKVIDTRSLNLHLPLPDDALKWIKDHGVKPNFCYRIEINADGTATFYCYAKDDDGRKYFDRELNEAARADPYTVPILRPMPEVK